MYTFVNFTVVELFEKVWQTPMVILKLPSAVDNRQQSADSVEKVGFSDRLNSGTTTTGEPTHHIEWFFGPSVTFAALLLG